MLPTGRICTIKDHEQVITHLCTFKNCYQPFRWVCYLCKDQNIHDHQESLPENYLIDLRNSRQYLSDQIQPILDYNAQQYENINKFKKNLKSLQEQIQTLEKQFQSQERKIIESLSFRNKINQGIIFLAPEEINKLLNLDDFVEKGPQEQSQEIFSTVINKTEGFIKQSQDYLQNYVKEHEKMKQSVISILQSGNSQQVEDKLEYQLQFEYTSQNIYCSQISPSGRYLAVSNSSQIELIDLENEQNTKKLSNYQSIKMKNIITTLQFSLDSEYLFAGDYKGILYCLDIKQKINKIYEKIIHNGSIQKIVVINNNQVITCSQDKSIIVASIIGQGSEYSIRYAHEDTIQGLEFDQKNNVIISCSSDNLIRFYNCQCEWKCKEVCSKYLYMNMKQEIENVKQIQLLQKNRLLATNGKQITIWEIQYDKLQLINLWSFEMPFGSIYSIENKFFYIDKDSIYVYANDLKNKTFEIYHRIENDHRLIQPRMYNQVKHLIVQSSTQINIFQRKQQQN